MNKLKLRIEFEDRGQDFTGFIVEYDAHNFGRVIDVEPGFQKDIWTKYFALNTPGVGGYLDISLGPDQEIISIKYPVTQVQHLMQFQIRLTEAGDPTSSTYLYFDATQEDMRELAQRTANEYLLKRRHNGEAGNFLPVPIGFNPARTQTVVQYSSVRGRAVRGGFRFKLFLNYMQYKFRDGKTLTNKWYEVEQPTN